jgi:hypothetical protein
VTGTRTTAARTRQPKTPQSKADAQRGLKNVSRDFVLRLAKASGLWRSWRFAERSNCQLASTAGES